MTTNGSRFSGERMPPHPLRRFFHSASGYWTLQPARAAWIVTVSLVAVVLVSLGIT
jgi:hypothetical protein